MKKIDVSEKRKRVLTINEEPTKTQQQYKEQVDVNNIMKKYKKTGSITHLRNAANGVYMDLTQIPSYEEALMQIEKAQRAFEEIPSHIRLKFNNDPSQLISYLKDPSNLQEAITYGLVTVTKQETQNEQNPKPNETQTQPTTI